MRAHPEDRGAEWRTTEVVEGHRVGVTVAGTGTGTPLVLLHGIGRDRRDWSEVLPALAARWKVVVLWGERDVVLPVKQLSAAAAAVPHARTRVIRGVGHMPQIEDPVAFVREVSSFLDDEAGPYLVADEPP